MPSDRDLRAAVEALADECASSACIHLNDLYGRLRAILAEHPATPAEATVTEDCDCESMGGRFGAHRPECPATPAEPDAGGEGLTDNEVETLGVFRAWRGLLAAVARIVADRERRAEARGAERAWDEAVQECHDLGWLHDWAKSDALARNPYRADRIAGESQ